ncbi:MAG: amino acid adenylation domain-containing protein, partial [bacterium]
LDFQVKLRGFRIELGEIETALLEADGVHAAAVLVRRDRPGDERLVAYVEAAQGHEPTAAALRARLSARLPDYMVPTAFVFVDTMPLSPSGKLDRRALPAPDAPTDSAVAYVAPRTPTEQQIAAVFSDVLGVERVGVHDDFFALGGHSLLAMRVVARLATVLPTRLSLGVLFEARTVAALATIAEASHGTTDVVHATQQTDTDRIERSAERGVAPLSAAQQAVWTAEQRSPDTAAYNAPMVLRLRGTLDEAALEGALDAVVARHEVLRTSFEERLGEAVQVPHASAKVPVQRVDLRNDAVRLDDILRATVQTPFTLGSAPLLRALIARTGDAEWVVAIVAHHLVFDGGSEPLFRRDLAAAYDASVTHEARVVEPLAIEFADYARWEQSRRDEGGLTTALAYWREALAGAPSAIDLLADTPLDGARDARTDDAAARVTVTYPPALLEALTALAREQNATMFMVLLAGFQALLSRFGRQDDLVIGVPVSGRDRPETQQLIGFLTNTLPLRATLEPRTTFAALVGQVRERLLGGFAHAGVPVERVSAELGRAALFDTLFVLQDGEQSATTLTGCEVESMTSEIGAAKFDLSLSMTISPRGLRAVLIHRTSRFGRETAERLLEHLGRLLTSAAGAPSIAIADLPLLGDDDRARLAEWNDTQASYPLDRSLTELLTAAADGSPNAIAVEDEHESLTYAALHARAGDLARALRARGVGPGILVGLCAERGVSMVVGLLGVLKAGGAYVPIDPEYPAERVAYMLADSGVSVLLTQKRLADTLPALGASGVELVLLDDTFDAPGEVQLPRLAALARDDSMVVIPSAVEGSAPALPLPSPDDPAYMIYTSGSTGQPKGALNAHRGIVNRLAWMQAEYGLTPDDVVLQKTPFSFDVSVWEFFWPLMTGAKLVMARPGGHRDTSYLAAVMQRAGVTVCHFVPSMLRAFLGDEQAGRVTSLRAVMASGEALAPDLVAQFYGVLPDARLHNLYGPTECAVDVSYFACPPSTTTPSVVPIGRPVANTRLYVLDAELRELPIGVAGELHIGGVQVGLGYHGRPDLTAARFVPVPFAPAQSRTSQPAAGTPRLYKTGDLARWRTDGTIEYLGRLDFQVKLRGFRIELGEIEQRIAACAGVDGSLVTMHTDAVVGPYLVGYYVARDESATPDAITATLRRQLPDYMVPSTLVRLDAWPLSPNGKVDRRALPAPQLARADDDAGDPPATAVERVLCRLVAETLGRERVGVKSDFFAMGGHSLLATKVVTQASRLFRVSLTLRGFFMAPTVAGLADAVTAAVGAERVERIAALVEKVQSMTPEERARLRSEQSSTQRSTGNS